MVKMMVTVVVIYAMCWLPLHSVTLAGDTNPTAVWSYKHIQIVWIASHWLAMSSCCYNPFVYFWMSSNFRSSFQRLVTRLCRKRDGGTVATTHVGRLAVVDRRAVRFTDSDGREITMTPDVTPRLTPRYTETHRLNT